MRAPLVPHYDDKLAKLSMGTDEVGTDDKLAKAEEAFKAQGIASLVDAQRFAATADLATAQDLMKQAGMTKQDVLTLTRAEYPNLSLTKMAAGGALAGAALTAALFPPRPSKTVPAGAAIGALTGLVVAATDNHWREKIRQRLAANYGAERGKWTEAEAQEKHGGTATLPFQGK